MKPYRATYGVHDNSHKLLKCDCETTLLPVELEGLTDRPYGDIAPGENWWPSVGCSPLGDWWCLWWTSPDHNAQRTGMVISEVALWPRSEVCTLEDLVPTLRELSGNENFTSIQVDSLLPVADVLITHQRRTVVICENLNDWPSIIAGLWRNLWPAARMEFSSRIALHPPQSSGTENLPWIYGVPSSRAMQWQPPYVRVKLGVMDGITPSRAAHYLCGTKDKTIEEIIHAIPLLDSDINYLNRAARAADSLNKLQHTTNFDDSLSFLRTITSLAPNESDAIQYKSTAVNNLTQEMVSATLQQIVSISNIELPSQQCQTDIKQALKTWINLQTPKLTIQESTSLLKRLCHGKSQTWWLSIVKSEISDSLKTLKTQWAITALNWLAVPDLETLLAELLPPSREIEVKLLNVAHKTNLKTSEINQIREQAISRQWPELHAWAATLSMSTTDAFDSQLKFKVSQYNSLDYLIDHLPQVEVVKEAVSLNNTELTKLVSKLTAQHPELLIHLELPSQSSFNLWAQHIKDGGKAWPKCFQPTVQGRKVLDAAIEGENTHNLIELLSKDLVATIASHPQRQELWNKLNLSETKLLLPLVAQLIVEQFNANQIEPQPERVLTNAVIEYLRFIQPSAKSVCAVLSWNVSLNEREVMAWVSEFTRDEWNEVSNTIGSAVLSRRWEFMANKLYSLNKRMPEVKPAVNACLSLLSWWDKWMFSKPTLSISSAPAITLNQPELFKRVAELGSELHPYDLADIWERAEGRRGQLRLGGSPKTCWQEAARLADSGALKGGLLSLVNELKIDFPNNYELKELEVVLKSRG